MMASSAARRPSYTFCVASACDAGSSARQRSSSSFVVIVRLPTRAAGSVACWAGAAEHANRETRTVRKKAFLMARIIT